MTAKKDVKNSKMPQLQTSVNKTSPWKIKRRKRRRRFPTLRCKMSKRMETLVKKVGATKKMTMMERDGGMKTMKRRS